MKFLQPPNRHKSLEPVGHLEILECDQSLARLVVLLALDPHVAVEGREAEEVEQRNPPKNDIFKNEGDIQRIRQRIVRPERSLSLRRQP